MAIGIHSQKRSLYAFFLTLALVVLIPMALLFITYNYAIRNMVAEDYVSLNERIVQNASNRVDASIAARMNLAYTAATNSAVQKLAARAEDGSLDRWFACEDVYNFVRSMQAFDGAFPTTAIWFCDRNLVISSRMRSLDADDFYNRFIARTGLASADFWARLRAGAGSQFYPCAPYSAITGENGNALLFAQEIDLGYMKPRAFLIVTIDRDALGEALLADFSAGTSVRVLGLDGSPLLELGGMGGMGETEAPGEGAALVSAADGTAYQVFTSMGAQTRLQYVYYVPYAAVLLRMRLFVNLWAGAVLVCLVIGAVIARVIAGRLHTQLRGLLVTAFPEGDSPVLSNIGEGFRLVAGEMIKARSLNTQFQEKLREYYADALNNTLLRLLTQSRMMTDGELAEAAQMCSLPTHHSVYQVAMLKSVGGAQMAAPQLISEREGVALRRANLSAGQWVVVMACAVDADAPGELARLLEHCAGNCAVGVSRVHHSLRELSRCMNEAGAACRRPGEPGRPVHFSALAEDASAIYYPLEKEMQIIAAVREGSYSDARILLADVLDSNDASRSPLPEMRLCLYHNMIATAFRASEALESRLAVIEQGLQALDMLREGRLEEDDAFAEVLLVYQRLCDETKTRIQSKNHRILQSVTEYLQENYQRPDLSLNDVAEALGFSYYFLSRIFRDVGNSSFSDMLNDVRTTRAIALLRDTDLPIQAVAEQAGYTNWSTFLRAFRKRTGTTPARYRSADKEN